MVVFPSDYCYLTYHADCYCGITQIFHILYLVFVYSLGSSKPKKTRVVKLHESFVDIEQQLDKITGIKI